MSELLTLRESVAMPARIAALPRDHRGFPVPYFVQWQNGEPVFPAFDPVRFKRCVERQFCWVCGQPLGRMMAFTIGPMCVINRVTAEPPAHAECAHYSVQVCPFLTTPKMGRVPAHKVHDDGVQAPGGIMVPGNPGGAVVWICRTYRVEQTATGPIIRIGDPIGGVEWWIRGQRAAPDAAAALFDSAARRLRLLALEHDGLEALPAVERQIRLAEGLLP
jgi:hypothetical protein